MGNWVLWVLLVHLVDEMERQETRRDLAVVTLARQQTCSAKRMYKFTGHMVEARRAQMLAMLLARRRSETKKRRRAPEQEVDGGGNWGL